MDIRIENNFMKNTSTFLKGRVSLSGYETFGLYWSVRHPSGLYQMVYSKWFAVTMWCSHAIIPGVDERV